MMIGLELDGAGRCQVFRSREVGKVYLPDSSYREMTEWVLPPERLAAYLEAVRKAKEGRDLSMLEFRESFVSTLKRKLGQADEPIQGQLAAPAVKNGHSSGGNDAVEQLKRLHELLQGDDPLAHRLLDAIQHDLVHALRDANRRSATLISARAARPKRAES